MSNSEGEGSLSDRIGKKISEELADDEHVRTSPDPTIESIQEEIDDLYIEIGELYYYRETTGLIELFQELDKKHKELRALDPNNRNPKVIRDATDLEVGDCDVLDCEIKLALGTISVVAMSLLAWALGVYDSGHLALFFVLLSAASFFGIKGTSMFLTGKGYLRWKIMGIEWGMYERRVIPNIASFIGLIISLSALICGIGMGVVLNSMIPGIVILAIGGALMLVPRFTMTKVSILRRLREPIEAGVTVQAIVVVLTVLLIGGSMILSSYATSSAPDITIDLGEDSFTIEHMLGEYTIHYDEVRMIYTVDDFDRGDMISGYKTMRSSGGTFNNDLFGEYRLAAFDESVNTMCIVIVTDEWIHAFNQDSERNTTDVYEMLIPRCKYTVSPLATMYQNMIDGRSYA